MGGEVRTNAVGIGTINRVKRNPRQGQAYNASTQTQSSKGMPGTVHTYRGGRKVFVRSRNLVGTVGKVTPGLASAGTGQHPQYDATPAPVAGPPPVAPPAPTAQDPTAVDPNSFKDSEYLAWQAQDAFERNQAHAQYNAEDANDQTARGEAIRRLMQRRPDDLNQADVSANKSGLFYSGMLGKARGDIEADYTRQQGDIHGEYDARKSARDAARAALEQGYTIEEAAQLAAAADRKVGRDLEAADSKSLAREPEIPAPQPGNPPAVGTARPQSGVRAPGGFNPAKLNRQIQARGMERDERARQRRKQQQALARARAQARRRPSR
jgi:hypothetical protein